MVRIRTEEDDMQQGTSAQMIDPEQPEYVTLLTVQREVGITRGTLKKYLPSLVLSPGSQESEIDGDEKRKAASDAL